MKIFNTEGNYKDSGLLIIRIGLGLFYIIIHGGPKIIGGPERWNKVGAAVSTFGIDFFPGFWGFMAAFAEFFGGIFLLLGLFFRPAVILMMITMFVAASQTIANGDPFSRAAHPLELLIVLAGLAIIGAGRYSMDSIFFSTRFKE